MTEFPFIFKELSKEEILEKWPMTITPEQLAKSGTEHGEQAALFQWAALNIKEYPQLKWLYAVPNGFFSTAGQKAKMIAEGLRDGVPDVALPVIKWIVVENVVKIEWPGLYIEMKIEKRRNQKDGGCSEDQLEWLDYLNSVGYKAVVCYGWEEARDRILEYLNNG